MGWYPHNVRPWVGAATFLLLAAGFSSGVELGRHLLGSDVVFGKEKLAYFDLPQDAELVLQSETDCPNPAPTQVEAKNKVLCGTTSKVRECMNISGTEPLWIARNCTKEYCVAENSYSETVCLLESYAIPVDIKNETRRETCGLDPSDKIWLTPTINFAALKTPTENVSCSVVTPVGVSSHIWVDCVNGRPEFRYRLLFHENREIDKGPFTCVIIPTCLKGQWNSMMVCYTEGSKGKKKKKSRVAQLTKADTPLEENLTTDRMEENSAMDCTFTGIASWLTLMAFFFI